MSSVRVHFIGILFALRLKRHTTVNRYNLYNRYTLLWEVNAILRTNYFPNGKEKCRERGAKSFQIMERNASYYTNEQYFKRRGKSNFKCLSPECKQFW